MVPELVLASRSPQRSAILDALGVEFVVRPPEFEELESGPPEQVARHNALGKALAVARSPAEVVLGVDTVVTLAGRMYGKPVDAAHARETLRALSGATHTVVSALTLVGLEEEVVTAIASTQVSFGELDEATIEWYVRSEEWRERAGGYAVQGAGAALVAAIAGDWTNVVGLPVGALLRAYPALLALRNNRFSAQNQGQMQD
jgi:septum formation protein